MLAGNVKQWRGLEQATILLTLLDHKAAAKRMVQLLPTDRPEVAVTAAWGLRNLADPDTLQPVVDYVAEMAPADPRGQKPVPLGGNPHFDRQPSSLAAHPIPRGAEVRRGRSRAATVPPSPRRPGDRGGAGRGDLGTRPDSRRGARRRPHGRPAGASRRHPFRPARRPPRSADGRHRPRSHEGHGGPAAPAPVLQRPRAVRRPCPRRLRLGDRASQQRPQRRHAAAQEHPDAAAATGSSRRTIEPGRTVVAAARPRPIQLRDEPRQNRRPDRSRLSLSARCHAGAGLHRLDGRRRRFHRDGQTPGGSARRPAGRRDRPRSVLPLQLPRPDGPGRPVPPRRRHRGRPGPVRRDAGQHFLLSRTGPAHPLRRQGAESAGASSATASWRSPGGSACAGCCSSARSAARRRTRGSRGCT